MGAFNDPTFYFSTQHHKNDPESWDEYCDQDEPTRCIPEIEDVVNIKGKLLCKQPAYEKTINAEVLL